MQRYIRLSALCLGAVVAMSACRPEEVIITEDIPTGGVRFINAVPDSSGAYGLDMRFVDQVESNAHFRISFRNTPTTTSGVIGAASAQYKGARAGNRNFAIFLDDTIQSIASTKLKDSILTVTQGTNQTVIMWGEGRTGTMKMSVIQDNPADPGAQVALRVINATGQALDVSTFVDGGTAPSSPTWAGVPAYSASTYVTVNPARIRYRVRAAGATTNLISADLLALVGAAATSTAGEAGKLDIGSLPGTTVAGSAISLIVFPRSTAGARTPQTSAFAVPAGAFVWDRRPPNGF